MNTVFATEPLVKNDSQPMVHFNFQEGLFTNQVAAKVVDLVTTVSGHGVEMWAQEEREIFSDLFQKGLWDLHGPLFHQGVDGG